VRRVFSVVVLLGTMAVLSLYSVPVRAQIGDVPGPGHQVPRPPSLCPQTASCTYDERTLEPAGYRFQSLTVCGDTCTTQYWISSVADGKLLMEIAPVRGGGMVAVARENDPNGRPAVRTILPSYGGSDPACCPSRYVDTTYTWDAASGALVPGAPVSTPLTREEEIDWVDAHDMLLQEGFVEVFGGP
jgi:hypothetical protein